ncbi:MAG TPA: Bug family tripartite tricarboxylate transporter substrate binding protein [Burkholderiaceae bacterium]
MNRRSLLTLLSLPIALAAAAAGAQSPAATGPIKLIVGYPAGGSADAVARLLANKLKNELGTTVVVDNRPGAGGQIAAEFVKNAPADGTTILLANTHMMVTLPLTSKSVRYDPLKDFVPLGRVVSFTDAVAVASSVPATSLAQWIALARADAGQANYGVPAAGSIPQFIGYGLGLHHQVSLLPVPYKGAAPLAQDLVGGQVGAGIIPVSDLQQYHNGKVRILAVNGARRHAGLPEVPTLKELGYPAFDSLEWVGLLAPAKTSRALVEQWQPILARVLALPEVKERLAKIGMDADPGSPEVLRKLIADDLASWGPLIKASGFKVD